MAEASDRIYKNGLPLETPANFAMTREMVKVRRPRVFCASHVDWLHEEIPVARLARLLALIKSTPFLDWVLLTRSPEKWRARMFGVCNMRIADGKSGIEQASGAAYAAAWLNRAFPSNIWLGATVENQSQANERIPKLMEIPSYLHFISCEPLTGDITIYDTLRKEGVKKTRWGPRDYYRAGIDWVVCAGESGRSARPMHPEWVRYLARQCSIAGVPFLFKGWGEWVPVHQPKNADEVVGCVNTWPNGRWLEFNGDAVHRTWNAVMVDRVGKEASGRLLDGVEHNGFPSPTTPVSHLCGCFAA
jgi:protein gp37